MHELKVSTSMLAKFRFTTEAEIESLMTLAGTALILIALSGFWPQIKKFFKFEVFSPASVTYSRT
jgi:hypothetical protein